MVARVPTRRRLMAGVFVVLSALSFYLDSLVFRVTPRNRLLFLWG